MKILIITQHIFPIQTPRSLRSTELIKEFGRRGFDVDVYAVLGTYDYSSFLETYPTVRLHNIPLKWLRKPYTSDGNIKLHLLDRILIKLFGKLFEFPNLEFYFKIPKILKRNKRNYDLLISIANPHAIHWGCAKYKNKSTHFPNIWVADCGDPYINNFITKKYYSYFKYFEHFFCKNCDFISVPIKEAKLGYFPEYKSKIKVIPQGFNFNIKPKQPINNKILQFAYSGTFVKDIRNPKKFFNHLLTFKSDFRFHVFTYHTTLIESYIPLLGNKLIIHKPINRENLIEKLRKMDFLLNFENINRPTALPSKLIDYTIVNRPILSINPENLDYKLIDSFFNRDYSNSYQVNNIMDYHISNVADSFLMLTK